MVRRVTTAAALAVVGLLALFAFSPATAAAHALLASSEPASGAVVDASPSSVVLTFTEVPDPLLSTVHVIDRDGRNIEKGRPAAVAGQRATLAVPIPALERGSYTVTWRTTSTEDGHSSAGAFAFGVGVQPSAAQGASGGVDPGPSVLSVVGRWLLYVGLALVLGGGAMYFVAADTQRRPGGQMLFAAWLVAALGGVLVFADLARATGVAPSRLVTTTTGGKVLVMLIALAVTGVIAEATARRPSSRKVTVLAMAAAAVMLTRVRAGHAAASSMPALAIASQWLHLVAVGVWIGGLPWLVATMRHAAPGQRAPIAQRFSRLAALALAAVVATGTIRSIDEVGSWSGLFDTGYGVTLLVKLGLVGGVLVLAAVNRFRNIRSPDGRLRVTAGAEAAIAAIVLVATAVLSGFTPSASLAATRPKVTQVAATGTDFATTMRVRLAVSPGTTGPNRFEARVSDFDSDRPIAARAVTLKLTPDGRTDIPATTVALAEDEDRWVANSPALTVAGRWRVAVLVETAAGGTEVPLTFRTLEPPSRVTEQRTPGLPTIYTITAGSRHVQAYVDPGKVGLNQVHFTYVDASGQPVDTEAAKVEARRAGGRTMSLPHRRLETGHFVADAELTAGRWTFTAEAADGSRVSFSETVRA